MKALNIQVRSFLSTNIQTCHVSARLPAQPPLNEFTWLTPTYPWLKLGDTTLEHDVLDKVDLLGCATLDPKDQQDVRKVLKEYADVLAREDLDLG